MRRRFGLQSFVGVNATHSDEELQSETLVSGKINLCFIGMVRYIDTLLKHTFNSTKKIEKRKKIQTSHCFEVHVVVVSL